jgi:hypothetical protein
MGASDCWSVGYVASGGGRRRCGESAIVGETPSAICCQGDRPRRSGGVRPDVRYRNCAGGSSPDKNWRSTGDAGAGDAHNVDGHVDSMSKSPIGRCQRNPVISKDRG